MEENNQPQSSIVTASSKPKEISSAITASTRPGFASAQQSQEVQPVLENTPPTQQTVNSVVNNTFKEALREKTTPEAEREAAKLMKGLMQTNLVPFTAKDFQTGNMLFFKYDAKFKEKTYDKTPLIIVLRKSKGYTLGINFHWVPVVLRVTLLKLILKFNRENIMKGYPIQISYQFLKPFILKMGLGPVIRLYITSRISKRGVVVPPTHWLIAAKLRAESFNNGVSAEAAYKKAVQNYATKKGNRTRREHTWK